MGKPPAVLHPQHQQRLSIDQGDAGVENRVGLVGDVLGLDDRIVFMPDKQLLESCVAHFLGPLAIYAGECVQQV
jgi:hypothetical protein